MRVILILSFVFLTMSGVVFHPSDKLDVDCKSLIRKEKYGKQSTRYLILAKKANIFFRYIITRNADSSCYITIYSFNNINPIYDENSVKLFFDNLQFDLGTPDNDISYERENNQYPPRYWIKHLSEFQITEILSTKSIYFTVNKKPILGGKSKKFISPTQLMEQFKKAFICLRS